MDLLQMGIQNICSRGAHNQHLQYNNGGVRRGSERDRKERRDHKRRDRDRRERADQYTGPAGRHGTGAAARTVPVLICSAVLHDGALRGYLHHSLRQDDRDISHDIAGADPVRDIREPRAEPDRAELPAIASGARIPGLPDPYLRGHLCGADKERVSLGRHHLIDMGSARIHGAPLFLTVQDRRPGKERVQRALTGAGRRRQIGILYFGSEGSVTGQNKDPIRTYKKAAHMFCRGSCHWHTGILPHAEDRQ